MRLHPSFTALLLSVPLVVGCASTRGRADDALRAGNYTNAVALYRKVLAENPKDAEVQALLLRAERALVDESLDRVDANRRAEKNSEGIQALVEGLKAKDRVSAEAIDSTRKARVDTLVEWAKSLIVQSIRTETGAGRALLARSLREKMAPWLARPELATVVPRIDAEIAAAGARTCADATRKATNQPFSLALVAAYCKNVGAPLPPWMARPLLVSGLTLRGTITGTPVEEQTDIERVLQKSLERSVWFSAAAPTRATTDLRGTTTSLFRNTPTELTRSWIERIPYETTETYEQAVEVPYQDTETYTQQVPYTAYEDRLEACSPPRQGLCNVSRPVTRMRDETRTRPVTKFRTEYVQRTRPVTRIREEARVFRYQAIKHEGRYQGSYDVRIDFGSNVPPVSAHDSAEQTRVAYEHDAEFAPAGVMPEKGTVPSAASFRAEQRDKMGAALTKTLDAAWVSNFCSEAVGTIETAARCAHARPQPAPAAMKQSIEELFGDDPDLILALPRPKESIE